MTIEEKAKAYDEALERAKKELQTCGSTDCDAARQIFRLSPELKESKDEKIRKFLIKWIQDNYYHGTTEIPTKTLIAWLEKQKTIDVLDKEEREFADNVDSYRKDMDEFYKKGYNAGREAEKQYWLEKQATPQIRTGLEWVNTINDACDRRYLEEYSHGEYCHEQSFKWGFQEGVDWLEKQNEQKYANNKEKLDILNFIRKETSCGLAEANNAFSKLIKVLKQHPFLIMDKPRKLKIEWEE